MPPLQTIEDVVPSAGAPARPAIAPDLPAPRAEPHAAFLEAAALIGRRIVREALWQGDACTWMITTNDPVDPWTKPMHEEIAGPLLYKGTAGIALFLTELHRLTGDTLYHRAATGALAHSYRAIAGMQWGSVGFHSGFVGVAYALARFALVTGDEASADQARDVLRRVYGTEEIDESFDVIGGAAGAIPVMLLLATWLKERNARESAVKMGLHLIRRANRRPTGWGWGALTPANTRDLTGLAHGAAGSAYALLELYAACGDPAFLYGARQAFSYERQYFSPTRNNWPDFRDNRFSRELGTEERKAAIVQRLRKGGKRARPRPKYMAAWCHGAPGIALTRIRAYELTRDEVYHAEALAALSTTVATASHHLGYSLCHGAFGNDAALLAAGRVFRDDTWLEIARQRALDAIEQFEGSGQPWPSGVRNNLPDPTLMLGEAGMGYHLLSLCDPDLPSVVLPVIGKDTVGMSVSSDSPATVLPIVSELKRDYVNRFFPTAIAALDRLRPGAPSILDLLDHEAGDSEVRAAAASIQRVLDTESDPRRRSLMEDAIRVDWTRYVMLDEITDYSETFVADLARLPADEVQWGSTRVALSRFVRLISQEYDWDTWLVSPDAANEPPRHRRPQGILLQRRRDDVQVYRLVPFAYAVLTLCRRPRTIEEIVDTLHGRGMSTDPERLHRAVLGQLQQAYARGMVDARVPRRGQQS